MEAQSNTCRCHIGLPGGPALRRTLRAWILLAISLSGCAMLPEEEPAAPLEAVAGPSHQRIPHVRVAPPPVESQAEPAPVAIIVSSDLRAYQDVADSLISQPGSVKFTVHALDDYDTVDRLAQELGAIQPRAVVAIGLDAALFSRARLDAPLIFCQVFNFAEYPELSDATAGVSMLAAFDEQLAFWRAFDESLTVVGTIVGPGHEQLIEDSEAAAAAHGVTLTARIADSDRETVYQFRRLAAEIDGFWLIPDNRILSVTAIEELMAYAAAQKLPVVVSTPELLRFGALMSLRPSPAHVATAVAGILDSLQSYVARGFELVTPKAFDVDVNPAVAARLGIGID